MKLMGKEAMFYQHVEMTVHLSISWANANYNNCGVGGIGLWEWAGFG